MPAGGISRPDKESNEHTPYYRVRRTGWHAGQRISSVSIGEEACQDIWPAMGRSGYYGGFCPACTSTSFRRNLSSPLRGAPPGDGKGGPSLPGRKVQFFSHGESRIEQETCDLASLCTAGEAAHPEEDERCPAVTLTIVSVTGQGFVPRSTCWSVVPVSNRLGSFSRLRFPAGTEFIRPETVILKRDLQSLRPRYP